MLPMAAAFGNERCMGETGRRNSVSPSWLQMLVYALVLLILLV
jgi:hypothetical protein